MRVILEISRSLETGLQLSKPVVSCVGFCLTIWLFCVRYTESRSVCSIFVKWKEKSIIVLSVVKIVNKQRRVDALSRKNLQGCLSRQFSQGQQGEVWRRSANLSSSSVQALAVNQRVWRVKEVKQSGGEVISRGKKA